ncbi:MAG: TonB-dependent receptor [Sphingomonadales bacterium]|nr:TonB-dependent receptor [Sphingomonadales bacterium]MDE2567981.1 TonB-dependent receptor [Sphingomonadales bacterium]
MSRFALRAALAASTAIFTASAAPAFAQDASPQTDSQGASTGGDEGTIIVTARRREETLVDVPIAMTALSAEQLANSGAQDITDIADQAPNVTLEPSRATNSTLTAFIRGIGQQDPVSGFEQGVGIYLDDVYLNRPQAAVLDIYDVQRVEVLRGPQGTLYGRNTVGGAVKYVTKKLSDRPHLAARATYGSYNEADGVLTVSTPVTSDGVLRVGGSVARLSHDGFGTNLTTGLPNYNKDIWAARGTIEVHGTNVFARLEGDFTHDMSAPRGGHRLIPGQMSGTPVLSNVYDTQGALNDPKQDVKAGGLSLFIEAHPSDWLTLRSITAWRKDHSETPIDFDALPAVDLDVPGIYRNSQTSQEFQALIDSGKLHGLVGFYYLNADALTQFDVRLYTTFNGFTAFTNADIGTDTLAGFADFTYDLTDQLSLELGGRYTWDKRTAYILRQNYLGGGSPVFGGLGIPFGAPSTNFHGSATYTKFTPRAVLSFKPDRDTTLYASFSQGFKGGGFDPRGVGINAPTTNASGVPSDAEVASFLSFRPEKVNSYEIGYKADLFDHRLYIAADAFYMDYTDVQIPGSVACTVGGIQTFCGVVSNAGKARMKGFEIEGRARLIDGPAGTGLSLSGSVGYIDARYTRYVTNIGGVPTDVAQYRKMQNTPAWTGNAALDYALPIAGGRLDAIASLAFKSKTYNYETPNPYIDQKAYQTVDASLVYHAPGNRWSLGVFGKNLFDVRYKTSGYTFMAANPVTGALLTNSSGALIPALGKEGTLTAFYGDPRRVFVTGTLDF